MDLTPYTEDSSPSIKHDHPKKSKFASIPIGLTQGQFNLNAFKIPEEFKWFQMRSACLMAFCQLYIQDPLKWSTQTINTIVINGAKVVQDNYVRVKENGPLDCVLNVDNNIAKIRIEEPTFLNTVESNNTSLVQTLKSFFNDHEHGLFRCLNVCYLIWKMNGIYFLFDGQGNGNCGEDKNAFASLICTESVKDVSKLLKTISTIKPDDCYSLSVIKMKNFGKGVSDYTKPRIQYVGTNTYTVISDDFAIVSGKFHVGHNGFQSLNKRQSIAVGLMALIYNEIQPSYSWNSQLIDKIILLGTKLFHECKKTPQGEVTIQHLPRNYRVLDYKFNIDYKPYDHSGHMSYSLEEMKQSVLMYLQRAFENVTKKSVLLQTNSLVFAVWECNNYYYIFDAYARNETGEIADDRLGTPCIHMHGNLESLCSVLCTNLSEIASNDGFVLHGINVSLECNSGDKVKADDLEAINTFMDDMFWTEMNNFHESSARSKEIYNLDESSDDDIFMETVDGMKRTISAASSESRSTISFASDSEASESRTGSSSKDSDSTEPSNSDSKSQISSSIDDIDDSNKKERRSKSRKNHKEEEEAEKEAEEEKEEKEEKEIKKEQTDVVDFDAKQTKSKKKTNSKNKGKKNKLENEQEDTVFADAQSEKSEKKVKGKSKSKSKKRKIEEEDKEKDEEEEEKEEANKTTKKIVVVESSTGTETSITKLLTTSFKISDRVLLVTEWGDFFLAQDGDKYFLFDGCLCDYNTLIQTNLTELDSSTRLENVDDVVKKILLLKGRKNTTMKTSDSNDVAQTTFAGDVDSSFWELIEGMIELMKTTAKFDKIKNDLL